MEQLSNDVASHQISVTLKILVTVNIENSIEKFVVTIDQINFSFYHS